MLEPHPSQRVRFLVSCETMKFDILTIFPEMFSGYFGESIIKRANIKKCISAT